MAQAFSIERDTLKASSGNSIRSLEEIHIRWIPPIPPWHKVNVDGPYKKASSSTACRGLIRDHIGRFFKGFSTNLGCCNALWAKLWALYKGIQLARDMHLN